MKSFEAGPANWEAQYGFVLAVTDFGDGAGTTGDVILKMEEMASGNGWSVAESPMGAYDTEGTFVAAQADPVPGTDGTEVRVRVHVEMSGRRFEGDPATDAATMARQSVDFTARATQKRLRYAYPEARVRVGDTFASQDRPDWARG